MKNNLFALAVLGSVATLAQAQSSVTVYGIIDTAIRYTNNVPVTGGGTASQIALGPGALFGSRVGFKGEEDLGGGMAAVFKLENGFDSTTGALGQQGQLFGRQEYVGLKDKSLGEIDAGRQYGIAARWSFAYDPLDVGNFNENEWELYLYGLRFDNTLKYTNSWGPVTAAVQYSVGGQTGSTSIGRTDGGSLTYEEGPFSIGGVYQQSTDANSKRLAVAGLGGFYLVGPAKLYLQYFDTTRDPGFAKAASLSGGALANTSMLSNAGNKLQRRDGMWTTGVEFNPTHEKGWTYTLGYMHDSVTNDLSADGLSDGGGTVATAYALAEYNLSKRTEIYIELDRTMLGGNEINGQNTVMSAAGSSFGGNTSRTGAGLGLIVKF